VAPVRYELIFLNITLFCEYSAVKSVESQQKFRRNMSRPLSGFKGKSNKKPAQTRQGKICLLPALCWFLAWLTLRL
jgi:hypothetical protein